MFTRISSVSLAAIALVSCSAAETPEPEGLTLDCAIGPGAEFASVCTLEWVGEAWERDFIIHHPGGGFRRFSLNEDSSGVWGRDGADEVEMTSLGSDGFWQFSIDGDQYRMPTPPPPEV